MAHQGSHHGGSLIVDCTTCPVRELRCSDCMVTALQQLPEPGLPLDPDERAAVTALVRAGLLGAGPASGVRARAVPGGPRRVAAG